MQVVFRWTHVSVSRPPRPERERPRPSTSSARPSPSRTCSSTREALMPCSIGRPIPTSSKPTARFSLPSDSWPKSCSSFPIRAADSFGPTDCTPRAPAAPLARQVVGGSRFEGTARARACAPRGWSRQPHLVRLAAEGWKRDHQPHPSVPVGPPEEPPLELSVSARQSRAAWARLIKKLSHADLKGGSRRQPARARSVARAVTAP